MNNFIYDIPTKVYFGENQLSHLGEELKRFGKRVLLVYGGGSIKKIRLYDQIMKELKDTDLEVFECGGIEPNPRHTSCNKGAAICKEEKIDVLLAVGGGSVIDATKVIGAAAFYEGDSWDLVTRKAPITNVLPIVSILTLSATGSEMDAGGVITNLETNDKIGIGHPLMQPKVSFLDPSYTYSVNAYQTACGSVDIMSHIIEVYFNLDQDLYMLDTVMEGLMKTVIKYAPVALKEPTNYEARANLMWASSWAINGFIRGGKRQAWSCHPIEHELSAYYDITHGLGLAILTPRWLEYTLDETTISKFYQFGCNVFDLDKNLEPMVVAKKSIELLADFFFNQLGLTSQLRDLNIDNSKFEIMAKKVAKDAELKGFKSLNKEDIINILNMCL
jgi:butanol dehydrogenase